MTEPRMSTAPKRLRAGRAGVVALAAASLAGCMNLAPSLPKAEPAIPAAWQAPASAAAPNTAVVSAPVAAADLGWREFFADETLHRLIAKALQNNRDLRVAVLNVERARAQYGVQRAARVPSVGALGQVERMGGDSRPVTDSYSATIGISSYEIDLFGRVRNLTDAALQSFFAQEQAQRSAHISLVAQIAGTYLTLAADRELLALARQTLDSRLATYDIARKRHELGAVSGLDLAQTATQTEAARVDVARYDSLVQQDINALQLLVGEPIDTAALPRRLSDGVTAVTPLPAGLRSDVLLQRPDIVAAEHSLRAANANIGAARAAFFPSISLTAAVGTQSTELSGLFGSGSGIWSLAPSISVPIFQAGRLQANLEAVRAAESIALAQYEAAIQSGFREVADALVQSAALANQRQALQAQVVAARRADELSIARYKAGRDSYLTQLDAQRSAYAAEQALVSVRMAELANRVTLYRALGGGWFEVTRR